MEIETRTGPKVNEATARETATILTASQAGRGWIGGLDAALVLLETYPNTFADNIKRINFPQQLKPLPLQCVSISGHGQRRCHFENFDRYNAFSAFGGDLRTQLIGRTVCALGHEIDFLFAMRLFLDLILPRFVDADTELFAALRFCLLDSERTAKIMNEGDARGMNEVFCNIAENIHFPLASSQWMRDKADDDNDLNDCHVAAGVIKWLMEEKQDGPYYTRSNMSIRLAAYLQNVGYPVNFVVCAVDEQPPNNIQPNTVVFLSHDENDRHGWPVTDSLALQSAEINVHAPILHYRYQSVGGMLRAALEHSADIDPGWLQEQFESAYNYIKSNIKTRYVGEGTLYSGVCVQFISRTNHRVYRKIARRLARIYFPRKSAFFAQCYNKIATISLLEKVRDSADGAFPFDDLPNEVYQFRAVTAAIVIAFLGNVADEDFRNTRHAIDLNLAGPYWLETMCSFVDEARVTGVNYSNLIHAMAAVHCAAEEERISNKLPSLHVAWRRGVYSIVPDIFLQAKASVSSLNLRLIDNFWADALPDETGSIRTAHTVERNGWVEQAQTAMGISQVYQTAIGRPKFEKPDTCIDINIERPLHYNEPMLSLIGRVNGKIVGVFGVGDILRQLLYTDTPDPNILCPGHDDHGEDDHAVIAKTSVWRDLRGKAMPACEEKRTFVPIQGDEHWALFLIGYCNYKARVIRGCASCAIRRTPHSSRSVLLGLGPEKKELNDWELVDESNGGGEGPEQDEDTADHRV